MSPRSTAKPAQGPRGWWPRPSEVAERRGPIVHALFRLSRKNRAMAGDLLRPLGLHPGQELLLLQLADGASRSQQQLVEDLGLDHSTVTKSLQRLERSGIVEREPSAADRRVMLVRLSSAGRSQVDAVERMWRELERTTVAGLTPQERVELRRLLDIIEATVDARGDGLDQAVVGSRGRTSPSTKTSPSAHRA